MNEQKTEKEEWEPTPEEIKEILDEEDRYYINEGVANGLYR
jgi:hypothetical protein